MPELIGDIGRQVAELVPQPPSVPYSGVTELAASVGRLKRVARIAEITSFEPHLFTAFGLPLRL